MMRLSFISLCFLLLLPCIAFGQPDAGKTNAGTDQNAVQQESQSKESEIQSKIDDLQARIKKFSEAETEEVAKGFNVTVDKLKERTETLQEVLAYYSRLLNALKRQDALLKEKSLLEEKIRTGEAFKLEQGPPYSLGLYDEYVKKLTDSEGNRRTAEVAVKISQTLLENAKNRLKDASQQKRSIKDKQPQTTEADKNLQYQWQLGQVEREEELSQAIVAFQETFHQNAQIELDLAGMKLKRDQQVIDKIRGDLYFDQADREKELSAIEGKKTDLQEQLKDLLKKQNANERSYIIAQKRVERAKTDEEVARAKDALNAKEMWRQTYQRRLEQTEASLELLNSLKELWERRYELIRGGVSSATLSDWRKDAMDQSDRLQQIIALEQSRQSNHQLQISKLDEQLDQEGLSSEQKDILRDQRAAVIELARGTFFYLGSLGAAHQMYQRFLDEIAYKQKQIPFWETARSFLGGAVSVWNYEVYVVDDRSITLGKIITALAILIIGIIIIRRFTIALHKRLVARAHMNESTASITEKMLYYLALLAILLFAMRIVNIPLTVFTFLGGAVAIGVGFGAQKLINNFISGFILMAEQPIKVGDLIQMDEELGWIEEIGARSTRVRTFSNINILVPNSYFLENNIINWTHTDNIVRGQVRVGVAYGSPTKEVKKLLLEAADEHGEVRKMPEPYVWFSDFGDNALIFDLYFWVSVTALTGRQRIESDLRFIIDGLFRDAGIVIAFPQRDVHLDTTKPLKVEVLRGQDKGRPEGPAPES